MAANFSLGVEQDARDATRYRQERDMYERQRDELQAQNRRLVTELRARGATETEIQRALEGES
jgi:hypothetical protein